MVNKGFPQGIQGGTVVPGRLASRCVEGGKVRENAADCEAVGVAAVGSGPVMATRLTERRKIRFSG